jgi:predicted DNA-binding transcriptional regulator AlpA
MDTNSAVTNSPTTTTPNDTTGDAAGPPIEGVNTALMARPVWTTAEVAEVLGVSPATVKRMIGERDFPRPRRVNRMLWWLPADIIDWVAAPARGATGHRRSRRG